MSRNDIKVIYEAITWCLVIVFFLLCLGKGKQIRLKNLETNKSKIVHITVR